MDEEVKNKVWEKANIIDDYNPTVIRKDVCGAWILYDEYENTDSDFGWVIDHVYPVNLGGGEELINLRPMHWKNSNAKGDYYPAYDAVVFAEGSENIEVERHMRVNIHLQKRLKELYHIYENKTYND